MKDRKTIILNMYFIDEEKPSDIAKKLEINKSTVTRVLQKNERYLLEKKDRTKVRKENHKEKTKDYIKKTRAIKKMKEDEIYLKVKSDHINASKEMSKGKRMTNRAYFTWNRTAFSYNNDKKRYDFFNNSVRSYDVPKHIKFN